MRIFASESVEKIAVPQIEQDLQQQLQKNDPDKEDDEGRRKSFLPSPKLRGRLPEAGQQLPLVENRGDLMNSAHVPFCG